MAYRILPIIALLFIWTACNPLKNNQKNNLDKNEYFKIEIIQNGKVVPKENGVISLDKKPFKFKLELYKTDDVFVSSSWGTYYYDYPDDQNIFECKDTQHFEDCRFVSIKTGNEDKFNVNKDIYVGDGDYQMNWFYYPDKDWHRLDEGAFVKDGVTHATVTVKHIYDMDTRDQRGSDESEYKYKIEDIKKDIYMVFATEDYKPGVSPPKELQREKFILRFK